MNDINFQDESELREFNAERNTKFFAERLREAS